MRRLAQAPRQQHLFLLPGRKIRHVLFKLHPRKVQLAQDRLEQALIQPVPRGIRAQIPAQTGRVLPHVGDPQPGAALHGPGVRHVLAAQQAQKARLPGAVRAAQRDPVALLDAEADAAAHGRAAIAHRDVPQQRQPVRVIWKLVQLQGRGLLDVFQQRRFFLDGGVLPPFEILAPLLHAARLLADVGAAAHGVGLARYFRRVRADLRVLDLVGPRARLPRGLLQTADLLFQLRVLRQLKRVLPLPVFIP